MQDVHGSTTQQRLQSEAGNPKVLGATLFTINSADDSVDSRLSSAKVSNRRKQGTTGSHHVLDHDDPPPGDLDSLGDLVGSVALSFLSDDTVGRP